MSKLQYFINLISTLNKIINLGKRFMLKLDKIDSIQKKIDQYIYTSSDSIGKGFSSQVYKGKNQLTDEEVAIKLIDMKFIKGEVHKTLLANEIQILKLLKHMPNILQVYDIYNTKTNTCIVTQLCQGGDLAKVLKSKKMLNEGQAINILKQIINGYKGIYRFGIIHRDLKPANIFFVNNKVKIADFGFAIKQGDIKKQCNYNVGSPVYMPLQALNQNIYSFKSDVWAIGVIFYEMLTGKTPWKAKTQSDLKRQIKSTPIKTLIPVNISQKSAQFLLKTLQINPVLRMSPEEMDRFFMNDTIYEDQSKVSQIQPKSLFLTQKRQNNFRTRAISNQRDDRFERHDTYYGNYGKSTHTNLNASQRKKTMLKGVGGQTSSKFQNLIRTTATMGKKTQTVFSTVDCKRISEYLVSQIHFCRFLYKLIDRINRTPIDQGHNLKRCMANMIFMKLRQINELKDVEPRQRQTFRKSSQYSKLLQVVTQYQNKYHELLGQFDVDNSNSTVNEDEILELIVDQIKNLYSMISESEQPTDMVQEVILLDYLITCKQLIYILNVSSLSQFHMKAKMETIVNGKPTKNITSDHISAICDKLRAIKIL